MTRRFALASGVAIGACTVHALVTGASEKPNRAADPIDSSAELQRTDDSDGAIGEKVAGFWSAGSARVSAATRARDPRKR
jgi:hypothetical protein